MSASLLARKREESLRIRKPLAHRRVLQFSNFFIQTFTLHHETETVAVRTRAKFQIASAIESEHKEVLHSPILTSLSYQWILTIGSSTK